MFQYNYGDRIETRPLLVDHDNTEHPSQIRSPTRSFVGALFENHVLIASFDYTLFLSAVLMPLFAWGLLFIFSLFETYDFSGSYWLFRVWAGLSMLLVSFSILSYFFFTWVNAIYLFWRHFLSCLHLLFSVADTVSILRCAEIFFFAAIVATIDHLFSASVRDHEFTNLPTRIIYYLCRIPMLVYSRALIFLTLFHFAAVSMRELLSHWLTDPIFR